MNRNEISLQDTWDLTKIYEDEKSFNEDLKETKSLCEKLVQQEKTFIDSADQFYQFLEDYTKMDRLLSKLYCYTHLSVDVEPNNQDIKSMEARVMALYEQISQSLTFVDLDIITHQETVREYLKEERFNVYRYNMQETFRQASHTLSKEMEDLLAQIYPLADTGGDVFDALRLEFEPVLVDGKEEFLNSATLNKFLKNENEEVRRTAYHHFYKEYQRFENVFAKTLSSTMKKDAFLAKTRHFEDSLAASLFADQAPSELFHKILEQANEKYRPLFHRYNALKKRLMNKETMYNYDLSVPLVKSKQRHYTIDECFDIILKCVDVFGDEYTDIIKKAKTERWIDFYPHVGKRAGAYSSGCYDTNPYILMNFIGDYQSLSTMIHELGHSCHTYLSNKYQPPQTNSYRIFVAEVASTVNEMLLIQHLLANTQDKQEKASLLYDLLENCVGLIFRQPMFADFEYKLHAMAEKDQPMSSQIITDLYQQLNQEYFGPDVVLDDLTRYSCYHVPHFYYNYYVYKYTLGMCCALAITARVTKQDTQQIECYLQFLKSGGSKPPIELLQTANVDPLSDQLYDDAFHYFEDLLNEFESLMLEKE